MWAGILLAAFQQLVGINVVKMYSNTIWQSVGVPVDASFQVSMLTALIGMNGFAISFGTTWGPVMWLMLGELFDSDLRTIAVAVCTAVNWLMNWLITLTFPVLAGIGLDLAYGLYTAFALLGVLFVWKSLPETKGRAMA